MTNAADTLRTPSLAESTDLATRRGAALLAAGLGLVMLLGVGFAPIDAVHNAAHDTRHIAAFPCH